MLDAIRGIVQALRTSSRRAERAAGISGTRLFVLQRLGEAPAMSLNDLAARTHTHQSSVSVVVSRLVADRLVRRTRSAADGRAVSLSLTARGARLALGGPDLAQQRLVDAVGRLPAARRRILASTLAEIATALDVGGDRPPMFFEAAAPRRARRA